MLSRSHVKGESTMLVSLDGEGAPCKSSYMETLMRGVYQCSKGQILTPKLPSCQGSKEGTSKLSVLCKEKTSGNEDK